jgi:hypothetical protein
LSRIEQKPIPGERIIRKENIWQDMPDEEGKMAEIMALVMGLMMTGVAIVIGGFTLDAIFWMVGRSLQSPSIAASADLTDSDLSQVE